MTLPENPALVRAFDHRTVAGRAEYRAAALALDRLVKSLERDRVELTQADWLELVGDMAASLPLCDAAEPACCEPSPDLFPPAYVEVEGNWAACIYICEHGREWMCGWALDLVGRW